MNAIDKALATQLGNIETRTGKRLEELNTIIRKSGLEKHGQIRDMLMKELGMGHGDANTVVHLYLNPPSAAPASDDAAVEGIYAGKEHLRPIHDAVMKAIAELGDLEVAPKKTYLSLRRKKQFAMVGPATKTQVEVGLNMKGLPGTARLVEQKPGGMCQYKVRLGDVAEVDAELVGWIRTAYEGAG
jgi:hypothetical protein